MILLASCFVACSVSAMVSMFFHFLTLWQRGLLGFAWRTDRLRGEVWWMFFTLATAGAALICWSWA